MGVAAINQVIGKDIMNVLSSAVIHIAFVVGAVLGSGSVFAAEPATAAAINKAVNTTEISAHQVVEVTTERVMKIITEAQEYYDQDPQRFYREIETVLGEVVDFDSFARGVMGKYASKRSYMALKTDEEKKQFRARMVRFSQIFRDGLVQTYAKGLLAFNGNKIEVLPANGNENNSSGSVTVVQHIYGGAEKPYEVHYKLRKNRSGEWKLRNVTIEAVNLGKVYQSQFYSAAKQYQGDIDKVIDNWSVDPTAQADNKAS